MRVTEEATPQRRCRDERGAVAIVTALTLTVVLVVTAMVLDFGLVRLDRQNLKSLTDSAAMSGISAGDTGTGKVYTHRAVCGALSYVRSSERLAGLPDGPCGSAALAVSSAIQCSAADPATHAAYDQTISSGGATYRVVIKAPYDLTDGAWSEEQLSASVGDRSTVGGCDQLGIQITESRSPGLGSLATDGDLTFGIRSAARVLVGGEELIAPALVLLERTACSALTVGAAGGGSGTYIAVRGSGVTPGSIHVDSAATGSDCGSGSNQQLLQGKQTDGIVAYGSPAPTGTSGVITSVATYNGVASSVVFDNLSQVYGTTATSGTGAVKNPVQGRRPITRAPVDIRYRQAVRNAVAGVSSVWGNNAGWTVAGCSPTNAELAVTTRLWIDCRGNSGITLNDKTIMASEIYFDGFVKNGTISMPNATRVYVSNTAADGSRINSSAITMGNGNGFCVRATCAATCPSAATSSRARVFIRRGQVDATGGVLRLCSSTLLMLGGDTAAGCVPSVDGFAPTATPCSGATPAGSSQLSVTGGTVFDWTAPNEYDGLIPAASQSAAWANFEDLAMWSESAGAYKFSGSGGMRTVGVYMVPNASPVSVGGGSSQSLTNAQYVARTFSVSGGGTLLLSTDPRNAVTLPEPTQVLVR